MIEFQVSSVAFDPYWEAPTPDTGEGDVTTYRFGSVGQVWRPTSIFTLKGLEGPFWACRCLTSVWGEFGLNWLRSKCFHVQPVTC